MENTKGEWRAGIPLSVRVIDSAVEKVPAVPSPAIVSIEGKPHLSISALQVFSIVFGIG